MKEVGKDGELINTPITLKATSAPTYVREGTIKLYAKTSGGVAKLFWMGSDLVEHGPLT